MLVYADVVAFSAKGQLHYLGLVYDTLRKNCDSMNTVEVTKNQPKGQFTSQIWYKQTVYF